MSKHPKQGAKVRNFSVAFEQIANFVAIAQTRDYNETIRHLILQCFVVLPQEHFHNANQIAVAIDTLFGIQIAIDQIQHGIDRLQSDMILTRPGHSNYAISSEAWSSIQKRIDEANALEEKVKRAFLDESIRKYPKLQPEQFWSALKRYLSRAFRRHGLQAISLLDPNVDSTPEYSESLSFLLNDLLDDVFEPDMRQSARDAIACFFAKIGQSPDRSAYILQLADGSFNYFSLVIAPDVADQLRNELNDLTLFLDTNFLFSILDLHESQFIQVSNKLIAAIKKHGFPFNLRYHEATIDETIGTIYHFGDILRSRHWSQAISRAAIRSNKISGIELKYHHKNAETSIDVDVFLKPYEHADELLKKKGILIYKQTGNRLQERSDLIYDYSVFLKSKKKVKGYEAINHDATVLDTVRQLRSNSRSSLEAKALLLTCDYFLYKFDWEKSRANGGMACTVLPNTFWQILRPYIPPDVDFDKAFAETFSLPEFRTISSGTAKAASKMLSILASYKDLPEDTAAKMLSNDLLLDRLKATESDEQANEYVESALAEENASLLEERAALARQLEKEKVEREDTEKKLEASRKKMLEEQRERHEIEKTGIAQVVEEKQKEVTAMEAAVLKERTLAAVATDEALREKNARVTAEERAQGAVTAKADAEKTANRFKALTGTLVGVILIVVFEFVAYSGPLAWLANHPNSYGLQGAIDIAAMLLSLGLFRSDWRKACWGSSGAVAIIFIILSLLGGPQNGPQSK